MAQMCVGFLTCSPAPHSALIHLGIGLALWQRPGQFCVYLLRGEGEWKHPRQVVALFQFAR
jgi:hypothetical protein